MDREVINLLQDTQKNLAARRMLPQAQAIGRGLHLVWKAEEARQAAINEASVIPSLRGEIERLRRQVEHLKGEVAKAQDEAKRAAVPRLEALDEGRREVRNLLRPFLKNGEQGVRMLALTIKAELDKAWGKEQS